MQIRRNITGERFGRLTALEPIYRGRKRETYWLCKCDCGKTATRKLNDLIHGYTKSCGCLRREATVKHGKSGGGTNYERWKAMKKRCLNPNDRYYHRYGGRGIQIYEGWLNDFEAYDSYITGLPNHNKPGYTIDRIDNDKGYYPGNLKWATAKEQANNRSKCKEEEIT